MRQKYFAIHRRIQKGREENKADGGRRGGWKKQGGGGVLFYKNCTNKDFRKIMWGVRREGQDKCKGELGN